MAIKVNNAKLHKDILKRLNAINKPQRHLPETLGVRRSTLYRISIGRNITLETFFKLVEWLDKDLEEYVLKTYEPKCNK